MKRKRSLPGPAPSTAPLDAPDPLSEEARLLDAAMTSLRVEKAPREARAVLGTYFERFPDGQLQEEARQLELETDIVLGDHDAALERLRTMSLENHPRANALRLLRAELLVSEARCDAALPLLEPLLEDTKTAVGEAAHWARIVCASRNGSSDFQAALRSYLTRFPDGPRAAEARSKLLEHE